MNISQDFFSGIEHTEVPWRDYQLYMPLFYQDIRFMSVNLMASMEQVRSILPSNRLMPYRILPGKTVLSITAYQYRKSDIDAYNEVSIGIPVTIDQNTPLFTGLIKKLPETTFVFSYQLPVTTDIALTVGKEFAGYPKFIAKINFSEDNDWLICELSEDGQQILKLKGRKLEGKVYPRAIFHPITYRTGYLLRSEFIISEREGGTSRDKNSLTLELGSHPVADQIKNLEPGRILEYSYNPYLKGILTPVIESFSA